MMETLKLRRALALYFKIYCKNLSVWSTSYRRNEKGCSLLPESVTSQEQILQIQVHRDITYRVTPRAIKNYTGNVLTNLATDAVIADTVFEVESASGENYR